MSSQFIGGFVRVRGWPWWREREAANILRRTRVGYNGGINQIANFFFSPPFPASFADATIGGDPSAAVAIAPSNYKIIDRTALCLALAASYRLFRFIGVCSFQREHRYYALEITCCRACKLDCRARRSFRKTIELRSIDTSAALPWNYERCPGIGLLFVFKIYFENPVASPRAAPSALYVHTRDGIMPHQCRYLLFRVFRGQSATSEMYYAPQESIQV